MDHVSNACPLPFAHDEDVGAGGNVESWLQPGHAAHAKALEIELVGPSESEATAHAGRPGRVNYEAAITDYKAATRLAPQDAAAFFNLGTAYQAINDYKAARKAFEDTIQRAPGHAPAFQSLGEAALELGDTKSAETAFSNCIRLTREDDDNSGEAQAHLSLGRLYASLDDRQVDAERELRQAIGLDEGLVYTEASYELGLLLMAANRLDEAISFFTNSAELFDVLNEPRSSVRANLQLGRAYQAKQNPAAALEALDRASTRLASVFDPLNPEDEQLQQAVETERNRLDRQPLPEDQP
jgi:predicted Zn-dependent protease